MEIRIELPGVKLGVVEADDVEVTLVNPELAQEMETICERLRRELTVEQVAELEPIREVRTMFRTWGVDPARYRPSAEALLRRVVQGKGLYRVSNVVDASNLGSIETAWPYGCYNRAVLAPPITFRSATRGETYEGIGKQTWHLEGRPVLADATGPFGSPISDSTRTMVTEATRQLLAVIYAPAAAPEAVLQQALEHLARRFERAARARATRTSIVAK
jgi:DNA/RNA-binding domain of Phe-tRNA-synthetase-like protein